MQFTLQYVHTSRSFDVFLMLITYQFSNIIMIIIIINYYYNFFVVFQPSLKKLLAVTEMLSQSKNQYIGEVEAASRDSMAF